MIEALGRRYVVLLGDEAHAADVERIFQESEAAFGTITALVNSAGISGNLRAACRQCMAGAGAETRLLTSPQWPRP